MKAIVVHSEAKKPVLKWETVDDIGYEPHEVLVNVRATAVNRADLSQARGQYPPPPGASEILGLEMAGEIAAVGDAVAGWAIGDRVCALLPGGGYAEQAAVPADMLVRMPDEWSFTTGAAVMEVWLTAFSNLFMEGDLKPDETILIHAGASGVGTSAIQLARHIGATVYVTAGSERKLARCRELGAALAVNYKEADFSTAAMETSGGRGVDLILDPVGGPYLLQNLKVLRAGGRLVNIGLLGGTQGKMDMGLLLGKSLRLIGSRLRSRPLSQKIVITRDFEKTFWPLLVSGILKPEIDSVYSITEAQTAHEYVAQNLNMGKVILKMDT